MSERDSRLWVKSRLFDLVDDEDQVLKQVEKVAAGEVEAKAAAERLSRYLSEFLERLGFPANVRNAVLVAELVLARLYPADPFLKPHLNSTPMYDISAAPKLEAAPYRGAAIVLTWLKDDTAIPRTHREAATKILSAIKRMGHLPSEVIEY